MSLKDAKNECSGFCYHCYTSTYARCKKCLEETCEECMENWTRCACCAAFLCSKCYGLTCGICERECCYDCTEVCSQEPSFICIRCFRDCEICQNAICRCYLLQCKICETVFCKKCKPSHFLTHYYPHQLVLSWTNCSLTVLNAVYHALFHKLEYWCDNFYQTQ